MNVVNKCLYHISDKTDWKVGDILTAGNHENKFWRDCKDFKPIFMFNNNDYDLVDFLQNNDARIFNITQNNIICIYNTLKSITKECVLYIREQVFEQVRLEVNPKLISRQSCLWLSAEADLDFWSTTVRNNEKQICVLLLELNGEILEVDSSWMGKDTLSSITYAERASHYWKGEHTDNPKIEYLFKGTAIVKEIKNFERRAPVTHQ